MEEVCRQQRPKLLLKRQVLQPPPTPKAKHGVKPLVFNMLLVLVHAAHMFMVAIADVILFFKKPHCML